MHLQIYIHQGIRSLPLPEATLRRSLRIPDVRRTRERAKKKKKTTTKISDEERSYPTILSTTALEAAAPIGRKLSDSAYVLGVGRLVTDLRGFENETVLTVNRPSYRRTQSKPTERLAGMQHKALRSDRPSAASHFAVDANISRQR